MSKNIEVALTPEDGRIFYQVIRVAAAGETVMSNGYEREPLAELLAVMNAQAPPGVRYELRRVRVETRPLTPLEDDNG